MAVFEDEEKSKVSNEIYNFHDSSSKFPLDVNTVFRFGKYFTAVFFVAFGKITGEQAPRWSSSSKQTHQKYGQTGMGYYVQNQNTGAARTIIGEANIHICAFCLINFFWNRLFLQSVNTNIWIFAPSVIVLPAPLNQKRLTLDANCLFTVLASVKNTA